MNAFLKILLNALAAATISGVGAWIAGANPKYAAAVAAAAAAKDVQSQLSQPPPSLGGQGGF